MNYNERLKNLINEAKSDGFEYVDGKFIDGKKDYVKVINVRAGTVGSGESNGSMEVFDKLYILSDEDYDKLTSLKEDSKEDDILECICDIISNYEDEDWQRCLCIETIVNCYKSIYFCEEQEALDSCSIDYECHLKVSLRYLDEYFMDIQVLNLPITVCKEHKQLYVYSYPINGNC